MLHNKSMKTNGIIRKVDGLGRVVIPREYRKLHRISLGDPMEISCMENGEIILRKMDLTLTLEELSGPAIRALSEQIKGTILVSNLEKWLSVGHGEYKMMFAGKQLPEEIVKKLRRRENYSIFDISEIKDLGITSTEKTIMVAEPIAGECDVFGALFVTGREAMSETDVILVRMAATILGNSLQKF